MKKFLFTALGFLLLALGALGAVIPVLPTTPFVLLSLACFSLNPAVRERVLRIKFFNEFFENYKNGGGVSKKTFILSLVWLWGMLLISFLLVKTLWVLLLLALVGILVTAHLLFIKKKGKRF